MLVVFIRLCFALGWDGHSKMSNKHLSRGGHSFFLSLRVIANRPFKNGPSVFALSHYFRNRNRNRNDLFAVTGTYRFRKKFFITIIIHAWTVTAGGSE